ncbi:MAG: aminopeptidase [Gemmatimonadetes bacterium]|nr:aminopeptidase [Gemmatimonadota bacterium]
MRASVCLLAALLGTACAGAAPHEPTPLPAAPPGPGVSLELARARAAALRDISYDLELDLTGRDSARGTVAIALERAAGAGDLVLDFRGQALHAVAVNGRGIARPAWDSQHIILPAALLTAGRNRLQLAFTARIAAAGAAIIAVDELRRGGDAAPERSRPEAARPDLPAPADGARYLYTLLVPSDAQLLFPVFDQPDLKARFRWTITVPGAWRVLANGALAARDTVAGGSVRWTFHRTPPISTYLAAFAAGPWHAFGTPEVERAGPRAADVAGETRLLVRRSRAAEADADTLLALNRAALRWLEQYFGVDYPFDKLDVLLAPAFPFGGMEHVGGIFYNESNFIFREPPTLTRRLGRANTVYHEVAHQWFGDLVTMRWFDDLWLKEGFATFMAARVQAQLTPDPNAWKTFYLRNKPAAYAVDVTSGTTAVWQELPNLDLAKSHYGAIVYNKAPSILRQLEYLVGEEPFRRGVQQFLRQHAYGNATWQDLLAAIGASAGQDLARFGEQYILRAGAPIVETELATGDDGRITSLVLRQRPAVTLPGDRGGWWPGRVRVRLGYPDAADVVLDVPFTGVSTEVAAAVGRPAPAYVFPNDGDYGYGIFLPDARSAAWLLANAATLSDDLARALAWGALWDLVREQRLAPARFAAAAIVAFERERDEQISGLLLGRATTALERYLPPGAARSGLAERLEAVLLERTGAAALPYDLRKAALDALLGSARSPAGVAALQDFLDGRRAFDGKPLPQPSRWAAVTRLLALGEPGSLARLTAEQQRDSTAEAPRSAFAAGAAIPSAAGKAAYFARYFEDSQLNEEWVTASLAGFNHELQDQLSLPWLRPALERAVWLRDHRRIFFLPRWLDAFIGGHSSPAALQVVDDFLAAHPDLPADVRRKVLQPRDELARAVQIRAANGG